MAYSRRPRRDINGVYGQIDARYALKNVAAVIALLRAAVPARMPWFGWLVVMPYMPVRNALTTATWMSGWVLTPRKEVGVKKDGLACYDGSLRDGVWSGFIHQKQTTRSSRLL